MSLEYAMFGAFVLVILAGIYFKIKDIEYNTRRLLECFEIINAKKIKEGSEYKEHSCEQ